MKVLSVFLLCALVYLSSNGQAPSSLRVDLLLNPSARINSSHPALSWVVAQDVQSAYQILLSNRPDSPANVWNSGRQTSRSSIGVLYKGPALQPSTAYYWKVRTWDKTGKGSPYSAVQTFYTGSKLEDFSLPSLVLVKTPQQPVTISQPDRDYGLYDFGKDGFGQPGLSVNAAGANDTLVLQLGEALTADGRINSRPPGSVRYRVIKVPLEKGRHSYKPVIESDRRNTAAHAVLMPGDVGEVLPYRYAAIAASPGQFTIDSVSRSLVTSTFDDNATSFTSSDTSLNRIWNFCKYTIKATSFSGYYVDGDRERIPYEADALITQLSHYSSDAEFTLAERTLNYLISHPTWPTEWSLQDIQIAWYDYLYSGDSRLVRKLYPELKAKLLSDLAREDGLISTRTGKQSPAFLQSIHYTPPKGDAGLKDIVDWPQSNVGGQPSGIMGETDGFIFKDYNSVVNAYYFAGLEMMARLATALGETDDAARYSIEAARVRTAFQHVFFDKQTNLVLDGEGTTHSSLHANFFALAFGLVPAEKTKAVVSFIHSRGMACSVYGAQFLLDGLARVGDADYALSLLTSKSKRSWFNMLDEGATMTMEAWGQEYKPNQDWGHAWGTAPANYIVRHLAGIQPVTPGFGEIRIKPAPGSVESANLVYRTIRGVIEERFENKTDRFSLYITLPGNSSGHIYLPARSGKAIVKMDGRIVKPAVEAGYYRIDGVGAGKHHFEVAAQ